MPSCCFRVGFLGNEGAAVIRIRTGKEIESAALIAYGKHARVDGLASLAVLFGALGARPLRKTFEARSELVSRFISIRGYP